MFAQLNTARQPPLHSFLGTHYERVYATIYRLYVSVSVSTYAETRVDLCLYVYIGAVVPQGASARLTAWCIWLL